MHYDRYAAHTQHLLSNRLPHKSTLLNMRRGGFGVFAFFAHWDGLLIHGYVFSNGSDLCIVTTKIDVSYEHSQKRFYVSYFTFMRTSIKMVFGCFQTQPRSIHWTFTDIQKHIIQPTTKSSTAEGGNHWYLQISSEHPAVLQCSDGGSLVKNGSSQQPKHYDHNRSYN